jgi:uncharacterized membrane protein
VPQRVLVGRVVGGVLVLLAIAAWFSGHGTQLAVWLPAIGYALVMMTFARSLRAGSEPLIATFCRLDFGRVPEECVAYTRRLTLLWAVVMCALAVEAAILALSGRTAWLGTATAVNAGIMAALFVGEHGVRVMMFPHLPLASPMRTGRIMLQALRSRR